MTTSAAHPAPPPPAAPIRARLLAVATTLLAIVVLKMSASVVVPVIAGLLLASLGWPIARRLRRHLPEWLSLLLAFLTILTGVLAFVAALGWSVRQVAQEAPRIRQRVQEVRGRIAPTAAGLGVRLPGGSSGSAASGGASSGQQGGASGGGASGGQQGGAASEANPASGSSGGSSGGSSSGMLGRIFGTLEATFSGLVLMLAFAGLAMAEVREVRERLPRRLGARGERLVQVASRIAEELRTYAGVKTITSVIAGVATTALSFAFGIDHPFVWGFLAFLLEYVPGVGSMLAILPPTLMALVQFGPTGRALGAFLAIGGMQVVLGNFIDPKIEGSRLDISPFVVLLSIVFWAWVWGPPGALLGVPATLCVIIACRQSPRLRWVAVLLATDESHRDSPDEPSDDEGEDRRDR